MWNPIGSSKPEGRTAVGTVALAVVFIALAVAVAYIAFPNHARVPEFDTPSTVIAGPGLQHPTDIIRFKERFVASELHNNRLAIFDDASLTDLTYFDPTTIGQRFRAPHFLATTPWNTLLISNGWGDSIVEIAELDGSGWKEFSGVDKGFRAPHGICVDNDGWIYVGDSLNSRLVRFRDMEGTGWQVFNDVDRRVSYIRELVCRDGAVWASNSYENRPRLNPGQGSNVLKITDFDSGRAEVVTAFPDTNATGVLPLDDGTVLVGQWGLRRRLCLTNTDGEVTSVYPRLEIGTPYGTYFDSENRQVMVAHFGALEAGNPQAPGGIAVYR